MGVQWAAHGCVRLWAGEIRKFASVGGRPRPDGARVDFRRRYAEMAMTIFVYLKLWRIELWRIARALRSNCEGQDLVEYALMAGFIVTGVVTLAPEIADSFVTVMSKANSVLVGAAAT